MAGDLIGRRRELTEVVRACRGGSTVALTGSAGVGKSRLLAQVEGDLAEIGWRVESIAGSPGGRTVTLGAMAAWLPTDPPASEALLLGHLMRTLIGDVPGQKVAVSADDAHLLDDVTLALLSELTRRDDVVVLMTVRTPDERPPTLSRLMAAHGVTRVDLRPLDAGSIESIAEEILTDPVDPPSMEVIADVARGNPLLLRELLADAVDSGALRRAEDGIWHLHDRPGAGTRVAELVRARTRRLTADLRQLLHCVAVAETIPLDVVNPSGSLDVVLAALEREHLVAVRRRGRGWALETDHPLAGEALRHGMGSTERIAALRALCEMVAATPQLPAGTAGRAVIWHRELGEAAPAAVAADAAWEALLSLDLPAAEALASEVATPHWRAAFVRAEVARMRGDGEASARWHDEAAEIAVDDIARRKVAMARAGLHAFHLTNPKAAIASLREAASQMTDPRNGVELLCEAAFHATLLGEFDDAVATSREVLRGPDLDALTTWTAAINLGYSLVVLGDVTDLSNALARARQVLTEIGRDHPAAADLTAALSIGAAFLHGRVDEAVRLGEEYMADLRDNNAHRGLAGALASESLLIAGDPRAFDLALESTQQLRAYDPYNSLPFGLGYGALIAVTRGEIERAEDLLAEVDDNGVDIRSRAVLGRAAAALSSVADPNEAATIAENAGLVAIEESHVMLGAMALLDALGYRPSSDLASRLAVVCEQSTSPFLQAIHGYATAVATGDATSVVGASDTIGAMGARHTAASALVVSAHLDDDVARARWSLARSTAMMLRSGATVPLWRTPDVESALSAREVEVAVAASEGRTDQEIADDLFLARRTVGNHLHRAYSKLEIGGRDELGIVFSD